MSIGGILRSGGRAVVMPLAVAGRPAMNQNTPMSSVPPRALLYGNDAARKAEATRQSSEAYTAIKNHFGFEPSRNIAGKLWDLRDRLPIIETGTPEYREGRSAPDRSATVWPLSQMFGAALNRHSTDGNRQDLDFMFDELNKYYRDGRYYPFALAENGDQHEVLYDDNAWLGLGMMQAYSQTRDPKFLERAKEIVPFMREGLAPDGGMYWNNTHSSRNTASNAPTMQFFLRLHEVTGDVQYLNDAQKISDFINSPPMRRENGLYNDAIDNSGKVEPAIWTYNQGAMIGANLQMAKALEARDPAAAARHRDMAMQTARTSMQEFPPERLFSLSPAFNAVYLRNLLKVNEISPDPATEQYVNDYIAMLRDRAFDPQTGLYDKPGSGLGSYSAEVPGINLIDQAAIAQILALPGMTHEQIRAAA